MANQVKLVMYSGGQLAANRQLHQGLMDLVGPKRKIRMTYIPYCHEGAAVYYSRFQRRYRGFGATDFHYLAPDQPITDQSLQKALSSDVIYLAGGNTFYFLKHLRKTGLLKRFKSFAQNGGVLAGLSAGAIILTPNIEMAHFPPYEVDDNDVGLKNLKGMNLVNFEFYPHYVNSKRMNEAMLMYSLISKYPVVACADGHGLIIDGNKRSFLGPANVFFKGKKLSL